ncbi:putative glyoxylase CFP32 [Streptomyces sp. RB5]|uniref:Putative glyoxylase CFP32 n=1 Tax=Streptomyces smaragdinus TaxID=2585196 RepID=A0A7K0CAQ6_9ACTN|nr:VOC family protein [Streptomyces smaragdinus]MQY10498.1 putative glyoxylase CFP32 [Streptomyces smaragdinus]
MLTTDPPEGAPTWVDLASADVEGSTGFYRELFGWEFQPAGSGAGGYGFLTLDGKMIGGVGPLMSPEQRTGWSVYFRSADVDATVKAAEQAGGTVVQPPADVMSVGRSAMLRDPAGAEFALWQVFDPGMAGMQVVDEPGALCWIESHTTDPGAAVAFYRKVFGWETDEMPTPAGPYTVVRPAGGNESSGFGGLHGLAEENRVAGATSEWHPYFEVTDPDAIAGKAAGKGATTLMPPTDLPDVGRIAMFTDPYGGMFAVIRSATPAGG